MEFFPPFAMVNQDVCVPLVSLFIFPCTTSVTQGNSLTQSSLNQLNMCSETEKHKI